MSYTYTQPTKKPDFATDDLNNGAGGAANVQEPSTGKKQSGWDFGEKPQREFFNWIHRITNNWIYYLDERVTTLLTLLDSSKTKTAADADNYFRSQW
jgi:hypothetical protein